MFEQPNFTNVPNKFFDDMKKMDEVEIKVRLAIFRFAPSILGVKQLSNYTKLSERDTLTGINELIAHGYISKDQVAL